MTKEDEFLDRVKKVEEADKKRALQEAALAYMSQCNVIDYDGNHCPEKVEHEVEGPNGGTMYLCDKCYAALMYGVYGHLHEDATDD